MSKGYSDTPDMNEPAIAAAHRGIEAIRAVDFRDLFGDQGPRFLVIAETPPDGKLGIASTGDDAIDTLRIAALAFGLAKAGVRAEGQDPDKILARWAREFRAGGGTPRPS